MRRILPVFALASIAVSMLAPAASADDLGQAFLQGIASAFGSSGNSSPSTPQGGIYPDYQSCNDAARAIRRPGVTAECNPIGGTGHRYQLVVVR
jgi:hypothetical protein